MMSYSRTRVIEINIDQIVLIPEREISTTLITWNMTNLSCYFQFCGANLELGIIVITKLSSHDIGYYVNQNC